MMEELGLTQRQIAILKAIIQEYMQTGEPVGSELIEKKYKIGASPATIRNEMVELAKKGFLSKVYFSSGRLPTAKAFRFYINNLLDKKELSTAEVVSFKNSIWDQRDEIHRLLSQATRVLSNKTNLFALALSEEGDFYYCGISKLVGFPEFLEEEEKLSFLLSQFEDEDFWEKLIRKIKKVQEDVIVFLAEEDLEDPSFQDIAGIVSEFKGRETSGIIGVVGPKRIYYSEVIPRVRYLSSLLSDILREQGY